MKQEVYSAFYSSAAVLDLSGRGIFRATGEDRVRLMHAMTTNHVEQLQPGQGAYALFLNGQGRILSDVLVYALEEELLIDVGAGERQKIYSHLDHYIIADDVTLEDLSEDWFVLQVEGVEAASALANLGFTTPVSPYDSTRSAPLLAARVSSAGLSGFRIYGPAELKAETLAKLALPEADLLTWNTVRIENRIPVYGIDFTESNIPQETGLLRALHFSKGCYLGQEIVERVRSRGHVNKRLTVFEIPTEEAPQRGAKLIVEGKETGEITSAAYSPKARKTVALGYQRTEFGQIGTQVELASGYAATVTGYVE